MKTSFRDYLLIVLAFLSVFACGYGVGRLIERTPTAETVAEPASERPESPERREERSLSGLVANLELDDDERAVAEAEIRRTAAEIRASRERTILAYHEHLSVLYRNLIERLGEPHASRLEKEKAALDEEIARRRPNSLTGPPESPE
jgi:VIT1/CCC1 family predicted Fe2+/Mn2+ transporter